MDQYKGKALTMRSMGEGFGLCDRCDGLRGHPLAARKLAVERLRFPPLRERVGRQGLGEAIRVMEGILGRLVAKLSNRRTYVPGENPTDGVSLTIDLRPPAQED